MEYVKRVKDTAEHLGYTYDIYDIDADPLLSVEYLKQYREYTNDIPFFAIYENDVMINCFGGILDQNNLQSILTQYGKK